MWNSFNNKWYCINHTQLLMLIFVLMVMLLLMVYILDICHFDTDTIFNWSQKHTNSRFFDTNMAKWLNMAAPLQKDQYKTAKRMQTYRSWIFAHSVAVGSTNWKSFLQHYVGQSDSPEVDFSGFKIHTGMCFLKLFCLRDVFHTKLLGGSKSSQWEEGSARLWSVGWAEAFSSALTDVYNVYDASTIFFSITIDNVIFYVTSLWIRRNNESMLKHVASLMSHVCICI